MKIGIFLAVFCLLALFFAGCTQPPSGPEAEEIAALKSIELPSEWERSVYFVAPGTERFWLEGSESGANSWVLDSEPLAVIEFSNKSALCKYRTMIGELTDPIFITVKLLKKWTPEDYNQMPALYKKMNECVEKENPRAAILPIFTDAHVSCAKKVGYGTPPNFETKNFSVYVRSVGYQCEEYSGEVERLSNQIIEKLKGIK